MFTTEDLMAAAKSSSALKEKSNLKIATVTEILEELSGNYTLRTEFQGRCHSLKLPLTRAHVSVFV